MGSSKIYLALGVSAFLAATFGTGCARKPARPNVLLITIDTLRLDRVNKATTPHLSALAEEGLFFTHLQSPRAKTTPALASLMTGLYPHDHGVRDLTTPLPPRVPVLAEVYRRAGYATGALIGNYVVKTEFSGMQRGFDLWVEDLPQTQGVPPSDVPQRTARSMTDGALVALGLESGPGADGAGPTRSFVAADEPWFLWLHYMDPHGLYDAPAEHRLFEGGEPEYVPQDLRSGTSEEHEPWLAEYNIPEDARGADGRIDAALVRGRYDAEVHHVDAQIGRLLERLEVAGLLEETVIVVTADHGESLGEHSYWFEHGRHAYEVTCRVPMILRLPEGHRWRRPPAVRTGDLSLVEVGPTLLELCGLRPLPVRSDSTSGRAPLAGRSRVDLVVGEEVEPRAVFCEKIERTDKAGDVQVKGVRLGDWKYLRRYAHVPARDGSGLELLVLSEEVYDLASDPYETKNLAREDRDDVPLDRLRAELLRFSSAEVNFEDLAQILQANREELRRKDPEALRVFEALGY
jgi:arylsulfatase A-like enzyme